MQVNIKTYKPFTAAVNDLKEKYGEKFQYYNGFHDSQLSLTEFIDNFVDTDTVADATIDPNANSATKDIRTLMNDMMKPFQKLLAFNKIFHDTCKFYGLETAREWLECEWNGLFYMHNASTSSFLPYSYKGEELITIKYKDEILSICFKDLYTLIDEQETYIESKKMWIKETNELFVKDIDTNTNNIIWTKVLKVMKHENDKNMRCLKLSNGISTFITEDHPVITKNKDISAINISNNDELFTIQNSDFDNTILEINNIKLTKDLGWLCGMLLSEGVFNKYSIALKQKNDTLMYKQIINILDKYNMSYKEYVAETYGECNTIAINGINNKWKLFFEKIISYDYCDNTKLQPDYIHYSYDFLNGIIAGMIDGDGNLAPNGLKGSIRITSRTLILQLANYLRFNNIFPREIGGFPLDICKPGKNSFKSRLIDYGISFNFRNSLNYLNELPICKKQITIDNVRPGNFSNKQYVYNYDYVNVIDNMNTGNEKMVYDITTETGHFICNGILSHNCFAYDLDDLVEKGMFFIDHFGAKPAKHLDTFNSHVLEFVSWVANRSSGAVGLPSYLIYSFWFWKKDCENGYVLKSPEYYRDQQFQKVIYDLNQPYMRLTESTFSNFTIMDREYITEIFGGREYPDGTFVIDYIDEIIEYQKAFMRMVSKIREEQMMTFPVLTFSLLYQNGKFVDEDFAKWCVKHNMEWNDSNFYVGRDVTSLSSCCRLISNVEEKEKVKKANGFINSIGGTSLKVGSTQVNTINLARIAKLVECMNIDNIDDKITKYLELLTYYQELSMKVLNVVRHIIKRNNEKGLLPNYKYGLITLEDQFMTQGVTAIYEAVREFNLLETDEFDNVNYSNKGLDFAGKILDTIQHNINTFTEDKDYAINIENVPGESANVKLCKKDHDLFETDLYLKLFEDSRLK